jgi:hypothetical protein
MRSDEAKDSSHGPQESLGGNARRRLEEELSSRFGSAHSEDADDSGEEESDKEATSAEEPAPAGDEKDPEGR